jgi:hypothetical protein
MSGQGKWAESRRFKSKRMLILAVMPGFMPGIRVFTLAKQDVDGRDEPGHDERGYWARCER